MEEVVLQLLQHYLANLKTPLSKERIGPIIQVLQHVATCFNEVSPTERIETKLHKHGWN